MKLTYSIALLFSVVFISCIQSTTEERIPVRYTVLVRNGNTGSAIQGASVELTGEDLVARTLSTNENGRAIFPSLDSYVNQVIVSAAGFIPTDTVDVVTISDSTATVILRTLNLAIYPEGSDSQDSSQYYSYVVTILKATDSQPISGATVSVVSGISSVKSTTTDSRGMAYLDSLTSRQNLLSVSANGYVPVDSLDIAPTDTINGNVALRAIRITLSSAPVSQ